MGDVDLLGREDSLINLGLNIGSVASTSKLRSGVKNLHYLEGADLLGQDGEGTTDGSHPNDLGFVRQADAFEPALRKALGE